MCEAVALGARVLSATADSAGVAALNTTVAALTERAESATTGLVETAQRASTSAIEASAKVSEVVQAALKRFQTESAQTLDAPVKAVAERLDRLLAADGSPIAASIKEVVSGAMAEAREGWHRSLTDTLTTVSRSLDATDPGTPFGQLNQQLKDDRQRQNADLYARIDRLMELVVEVRNAANTTAAVAAVRKASPAKGKPYEEAVGAVVEGIACGIGASYTETSDVVGEIRGCKKGDGVIEVAAADSATPAARVVLEFTTSGATRNWPNYLADAERNRGAQASLGIVPTRDLVPGKEMIAILGPGRAVIAYDVEDDPGMVRATIQLLVVQAQRRVAEARGGDLGVADRKIAEAHQQLVTMQDILKSALTVRAGASKVVTGLEALHVTLSQLLGQAQAAIRASVPAAGDQ
ncbi:hypothetical protein A5688_03115 [Mycobacterium mantenii]|nr:hypothetical protein A5688_03115 [Mycobacterium mantenii]